MNQDKCLKQDYCRKASMTGKHLRRGVFALALSTLMIGCNDIETQASQSESNNSTNSIAIDSSESNTMLVEKKRFTLDSYTTHFGEVISPVNVGWESYGELNADKSNAILITHYFTGNSHAAGKYSADDEEPGYWDAIIGPGKAIDTNRFFVISVDSLVNISANDPNVITTGPASINPATGEHYGLDFPVVTMRDFVNVQKAVIDSLGIEKLHAVVGPSMGSMQAIEWAASYPQMVERMVSVIGSTSQDAWTATTLDQWTWPIMQDSNWNNGNYYGTDENGNALPAPTQGLTEALAKITWIALAPEFFNNVSNQLIGDNLEIERQRLSSSINERPAIVNWLKGRAAARADLMDANHLLYLVRANQLFMAGMKEDLPTGLSAVQAKSLFVTARSDLLLMPYHAELAHKTLTDLGKSTTLKYIDGPLGHLEGVTGIEKAGATIKAFLEQ